MPSRNGWVFCLLLAVATVAVYGGVFTGDLIRFDDSLYITQNRHAREGLTLDGVEPFTSSKAPQSPRIVAERRAGTRWIDWRSPG